MEEGCELIGGSSIIAPRRIASADPGRRVVVARCDLDACNSYKAWTFNTERHRQPDQYRRIVEQTGAELPS
jgi:N-carbamoyl-D-amino-acid hydrolase